MCLSFRSAVEKLLDIQNDAKKWKAGPISISVATSLTDDNPKIINISDTIGHGKYAPRKGKRNDSNCYWLPSTLNENNDDVRQTLIHPMFVLACREAGFIVHAEYEPSMQAIRFSCKRGKRHDEAKQKKYLAGKPRNVRDPAQAPIPRKRKTQLALPPKSDDDDDNDDNSICPFYFNVYWDEESKRWFLPHQQKGSLEHCGHMHICPQHLKIQSRHVPGEEIKISKDALDAKISATSTGTLLKKRTGIALDWQQLQYLKNKDKNALVMSKRGDKSSGNITTVDRLLADLDADPETSYICLFGELNSGLITIKTKKKNSNVEEVFTSDLGDDTDSPEAFAKDMMGKANLIHTGSGQMLLAIAWTNDEARRKLDMYPEFMGGDDTEETNSEDRPLYTLMGKDNNNLSFGHTWCFMPSKAMWVYRWLFEHAVALLHPGTAKERVEVIASDADAQETRAIESVIGMGIDATKPYPKAKHRHCAFHKLDRNLKNDSKYKSKIAAVRDRNVNSRVEIDIFLRWLWYYCKHYENDDQVDLALRLMNHYLREDESLHFGEIGDDLRMELREFITRSFVANRHKLFEASFDLTMTLGNSTTGINEAEHRAYKKHVAGPLPQHDLAESRARVDKINEDKNERKMKKVAFDNNAVHAKAADREQHVQGLTDYASTRLRKEHDESHKYQAFRQSRFEFYVKRDYNTYDTSPEEDCELPRRISQSVFNQLKAAKSQLKKQDDKKRMERLTAKLMGDNKGNLPEYKQLLRLAMKYVIPRFENTHRVKIQQLSADGDFVLVCDCKIFTKYGHGCRHVYRILKRRPLITDAKVRWHNGYALHYGIHKELSSHYLSLRDSFEMPGVPISKV